MVLRTAILDPRSRRVRLALSAAATMAVSAAATLAASPAAARDLPIFLRAAPPGPECGPGSLVMPGIGGCIRLGGAAWAEFALSPSRSLVLAQPGPAAPVVGTPAKSLSSSGLQTRAYLDVDVRTPTALGPVRTYVSIRAR